MQALAFVFLGLLVGVFSGMVGVGGGIVFVPALAFFFGFSQHLAQGTSMALMVPPIGILAAWTYYKNGMVDLRAAALICAGFLIGGLFGAQLAVAMPKEALRRVFGAVLLLASLKMIFGR